MPLLPERRAASSIASTLQSAVAEECEAAEWTIGRKQSVLVGSQSDSRIPVLMLTAAARPQTSATSVQHLTLYGQALARIGEPPHRGSIRREAPDVGEII